MPSPLSQDCYLQESYEYSSSKLKWVTTLFVVLMSVQIIGIEGHGTSVVKVATMLIMCVIGLLKAPYISKAVIWGFLYLSAISISIFFNLETFRTETVLYKFAAVCAFIAFYNIVYITQVFSLDDATRLVKGLIVAYVAVALIQQILKILILGHAEALFINLIGLDRNILAVNSLSIEPSHTARILGALAIVLLRLYECRYSVLKDIVRALWTDFKWGIIGLLWCFLTMGSGTGMMVLIIICLYFMKRQYAGIFAVLAVIVYLAAPYIEYKPFKRLYNTLNAATSLDRVTIQEADLSASARVLPYVYTLKNFDLSKKETWIGHGIDTGIHNDRWGTKQMVGGMTDYGFIQYIFALGLIFSCCIRKFISIEALYFFIILRAGIENIYVWWSVFMLFSISYYFSHTLQRK